jgi:acetylornithine deacetylase/succinyl-diaminopimelate desuccinylase-like protein
LGVAFEEVLERRGLVGVIREVLRVEPQPVPPALVSLLEAAAAAVGVPTMRLASGAAHDAMVMGRITDSGMIFVASRGGRSHTPEEHTDLTDLAAGATVLADALTRFPTS